METDPERGPRRLDDELYESRKAGFLPSGEPEFEDEPPGAALREVRMGPGWLAGASVQLVLLILLAIWAYLLEAEGREAWRSPSPGEPAATTGPAEPLDDEEWPEFTLDLLGLSPAEKFPLEVIWNLLPVTGVIFLLGAIFIRVNQARPTPREARRGQLVVGFQLLTVLGWFCCRIFGGLSFWDPQ